MIAEQFRDTVQRAADLAGERGHEYVTLEHLLYALTDDPDARPALTASGTDLGRLKSDLDAVLDTFETVNEPPELTFTVQEVVQDALLQRHASGKGSQAVTGDLVLIELMEQPDSFARAALEAPGRDPAGAAGVRQSRRQRGKGGGRHRGHSTRSRGGTRPAGRLHRRSDRSRPRTAHSTR